MSRAPRLTPLLLSLLLGSLPPWSTGCQRLPPGDVVARVAGEDVRYEAFSSYLESNLGEAEATLDSAVLSPLFDQFLEEELLLRLAVEEGLAAPGASRLEATDALTRRAMAEIAVTQREMVDYYQTHLAHFEQPERVRLSQILVEDREVAEEALEALRRGEEFADVAERLSTDPSAPFGGDQGVLTRRDLPPPLVDIVFGLGVGEVSPIVPVDYGFHIFRVTERLPPEVISLGQAEGEILEELRRQHLERALIALVDEARSRYHTEVYTENLPFDYRGQYRETNHRRP